MKVPHLLPVAIAILLSVSPSASAAVSASSKPNIVFLLADDLGWADLACYGSSFHETPNLDRMAREGLRFSTFYTAGSVCSPTRSSIMTGKYPVRTGITDWIPGQKVTGRKLSQLYPARQLALEEVTVAESLRAGGYKTAYIGKWHLGGNGFLPTDQGFEFFVGDEEPVPANEAEKLKGRLESTERFTRAALGFLEKHDRTKPFFLVLSWHDVHTPIQPMPGLVERFEKKAARISGPTPEQAEREGRTRLRQDEPAYASMVAGVDQSAGQLRKKLEDLGLHKNTIVIFTSDNGGLSTSRNLGRTSNAPLRAGKGWLYEGGIRVPMIVCGSSVPTSGAVLDTPLLSCDFYPTFLELAGLPPRPEQHTDGVSFADLIHGGSAPAPRTVFWHYPHYHGSSWTPGAAVRDGDWKLIEFYDEGKVELYNLARDPYETGDLAASKPEKRRELLDKLHRWQKAVNAQIPSSNPVAGASDAGKAKKRKK